MGRSMRELYLHFVWTTEDRDAVLRGELEHFVHRRFRQIAEDHGLTMIAANSAWDHVHLLVQWNTTTRIDDLVREWKSRTYTEWNGDDQKGPRLAWQEGCGAFSVSRHEVKKLKNYIANQKRHHRDGTTIYRYERRYGGGILTRMKADSRGQATWLVRLSRRAVMTPRPSHEGKRRCGG